MMNPHIFWMRSFCLPYFNEASVVVWNTHFTFFGVWVGMIPYMFVFSLRTPFYSALIALFKYEKLKILCAVCVCVCLWGMILWGVATLIHRTHTHTHT